MNQQITPLRPTLKFSQSDDSVECHQREIREIILFCYGDSRLASTWSNVPYLMSCEFERRGIKVCRVDLSSKNNIFTKLANRLYKAVYGPYYTYIRSDIFRFLTNRKIKRALKQYPDADFAVFLMFDFIPPKGAIPTLIFSDWTYKMLVKERNYRELTGGDRKFVRQQNEAIDGADIVLPLFAESYNTMIRENPNANIRFIDTNVVNNLYSGNIEDLSSIVQKKCKSDYILFIGKKAYAHGLRLLVDAIKASGTDIRLEVIGMTSDDVGEVPEFCRFHGFLHKDIKQENEKYYDLLMGAKAICNPTPVWAGYSSLIEAMYFYTPVITSPFKQFEQEFGKQPDFGFYTDGDDLKDVLGRLFSLSSEEYCKMAFLAHEKVKDYTWDNYVGQMLEMMKEKL